MVLLLDASAGLHLLLLHWRSLCSHSCYRDGDRLLNDNLRLPKDDDLPSGGNSLSLLGKI